jgi:hypothetical protein
MRSESSSHVQSVPQGPTAEHSCIGDQAFNTQAFGERFRSKSQHDPIEVNIHSVSLYAIQYGPPSAFPL